MIRAVPSFPSGSKADPLRNAITIETRGNACDSSTKSTPPPSSSARAVSCLGAFAVVIGRGLSLGALIARPPGSLLCRHPRLHRGGRARSFAPSGSRYRHGPPCARRSRSRAGRHRGGGEGRAQRIAQERDRQKPILLRLPGRALERLQHAEARAAPSPSRARRRSRLRSGPARAPASSAVRGSFVSCCPSGARWRRGTEEPQSLKSCDPAADLARASLSVDHERPVRPRARARRRGSRSGPVSAAWSASPRAGAKAADRGSFSVAVGFTISDLAHVGLELAGLKALGQNLRHEEDDRLPGVTYPSARNHLSRRIWSSGTSPTTTRIALFGA